MAVQVVKTLVSTAGGTGSTPVWGTKSHMPHRTAKEYNLKKKREASGF